MSVWGHSRPRAEPCGPAKGTQGPHADTREAEAWEAASARRRTLACRHRDLSYGERRSEIRFTGPHLDVDRIAGALDATLVTDAKFSRGRAGWTGWSDPPFSHTDSY